MAAMKKWGVISILFILLGYNTSAQEPNLKKCKNNKDSIKAWITYCDFLLGYGEGAKEDYPALIGAGKKGMTLPRPGNYGRLALFSFFAAVGYEFSGQPDSAYTYYKISEGYAIKGKDIDRQLEVYKQLIGLGKEDEKEAIAYKMLKIADTAQNPEHRMEVYSALYKFYRDKNQFEKAISYNLQSLELRKEHARKNPKEEGNIINIGVEYTQIGDMYFRMGQHDKAMEYFRYALPYATDKYFDGTSLLYNDILGLFLVLDQPDSAKVYYDKVYGLAAKGYEGKEALSFANRSYAEYYMKKGQGDKALDYAKRAYALSLAEGGEVSIMHSNIVLGDVYFERKEYNKALEHMLAVPFEAREYDKESYNAMQLLKAQSYAALGEWKKAAECYSDFAFTKDTLLNEAGKRNIAEMEARFQNKQKQQRINILDIENRLQSATIKNVRTQRVILIGGIGLLCVVLILLYNNYRNKQRNARILDEKNAALREANKTKATLFSVISHDLRSPISQLYQYLQLQQNHPNMLDEEKKKQHSERISNATASLLETMEDMLVWSKTQMERFVPSKEQVDINNIVQDTITLLGPDCEAKSLTINNEIADHTVVKSDANLLKIIVRNLVQNAIQYSLSGTSIHISAMRNNTEMVLVMKDEGVGMSDDVIELLKSGERSLSSNRKGLGWTLVRDMATSINASIDIQKNHPQGTIITLTVPDMTA